MIGRRGLLGTMGAIMGGWIGGGLPPPRPDQVYNPPSTPMPPGTAAGVQRARKLIVGSSAPFMVATTVNFTVGITGAAGSITNLASISPLTGVIAFVPSPTAVPVPASPMQGPVTITYTDASTANGYLILSGITGFSNGEFQLYVATNNSYGGGIIYGRYNTQNPSIAAITLVNTSSLGANYFDAYEGGPSAVFMSPVYVPAAPGKAGAGWLVPPAETWTGMAALGYQNGWADQGAPDQVGRYRLIGSPPASVQLDGVIKPGTITNGTVIVTLPAAYRPVTLHDIQVEIRGAAPAAGTRLTLQTNGTITCTGIPAGTTVVEFNLIIPLD